MRIYSIRWESTQGLEIFNRLAAESETAAVQQILDWFGATAHAPARVWVVGVEDDGPELQVGSAAPEPEIYDPSRLFLSLAGDADRLGPLYDDPTEFRL